MVQIKITPEELEQVAKRANDTKHALESIHNNLCNQIDYMCFQWTGASNQNFVQMFNNARPSAFTAINALLHVEEELKRIAEKFRVTDSQDVTTQKSTTHSKAPEKSILEKVWDGIVDGAGDAVGDTIDGIKALGDWETWKGMGYTVTHLDEALPAMWDALSDSFNKDVINGDAETRARWGSYALTQIGLGFIGDKGVSKAAKLAQGAKFSQGISKAGQLFNNGDNLAFAGGSNGIKSGFDSALFRQAEAELSSYQFAKGENTTTVKPGDSSSLAPGGGLATHEARGGHLLERHVGKTDEELLQRLESDTRITGASTFTDRATAENIANNVLNNPRNQELIQNWLNNSRNNRPLALPYSGNEIIGRGIQRGSTTIEEMTNAKIILKKDANGKFILTGYPN
ncbi:MULTISPECIES: WXG100 family type VII secretion target [Bacillus cereus group]|uniref:WXG100 family type VII secretion target n=1 Tax=Bacillus cereus VD021 TaxID=1053224 RepID=R8HMD6_BACCE|nr:MULTISPECIES: WXG100 family type VII secretion target [Bacillus cereus group]EOO74029.1 WXG100 family type VII secretion target [Bacillus cereus VD021]QWH06255.1 WXG100 family type VII secretion target [Bacillus mycoides]